MHMLFSALVLWQRDLGRRLRRLRLRRHLEGHADSRPHSRQSVTRAEGVRSLPFPKKHTSHNHLLETSPKYNSTFTLALTLPSLAYKPRLGPQRL